MTPSEEGRKLLDAGTHSVAHCNWCQLSHIASNRLLNTFEAAGQPYACNITIKDLLKAGRHQHKTEAA
jgi:hypothetical protein